MASTYPIEVVQANRWLQKNKKLKGDDLKAALDKQTWDVSVKSLVSFPDVLDMMNDKLDWTQNLGDAFLAQQKDVMDTVQELRKKAVDAGNLKSTQQQELKNDGDVIIIQPANPQVIYVPVYDPTVIYGPWWYPAYPPYPVYAYPPGAAFFTFSMGVVIGASWYGWNHGCNWHGGTIIVNPPPPPPGPRPPHPGPPGPPPPGPTPPKPGPPPPGPNPPHPGPGPNPHPEPGPTPPNGGNNGEQWQHNPDHRQGVPYSDTATRDKYSPSNPEAVDSRMDYRGYDKTGTGAADSASGRQPDRVQNETSRQSDSEKRGRDSAFEDMDRGDQVQRDSERGSQSMGSSRSQGVNSSRSSGGSFHGGGGRGRF
jgi:uncharacterized membrane protein YgcG